MSISQNNSTKAEGRSQESSAEPHPKDGHLRMPNNLVERLAKLRLTGTQWQILWGVWRHTLCWQQHGDWGNRPYPISIDDLVDDTAINEYQLKRGMSDLVEMNIILRDNTPGGRHHKAVTAFNLDPSTWKVPLKSSEIATLTGAEAQEKGSKFAPPFRAKMLPFPGKNATLSEAKPKLLNKHLNKTAKEDGVAPTTEESKILTIIKELRGWRYREGEDIAWLREFMSDYSEFSLAEVKACRDYYSGRVPPKHKGVWKNRFRNWMLKEREFEKGGAKRGTVREDRQRPKLNIEVIKSGEEPGGES